MEFLLGLLTMTVFFIAVTLAYKAGQRVKKPPSTTNDEDKRKAVELHKHFTALMNYDVNTALHGKKVI